MQQPRTPNAAQAVRPQKLYNYRLPQLQTAQQV
jgi:hypothetical protein